MKNEIPKPLTTPNIQVLIDVLQEYMEHLSDEDTCEDTQSDMDHEILEAAIEAIYGDTADAFISECLDEIENRD